MNANTPLRPVIIRSHSRLVALFAALCCCCTIATLARTPVAEAAIQHHFLSQITEAGGKPFEGSVCGVAVDPATQEVYVADPGRNAIFIYSSKGKYEREISGLSITGGKFNPNSACSLAVDDKTGDVYVADAGPGLVYVFNSLGGYVTTMSGANTPAKSFGGGIDNIHVAVDQASGDVYVSDEYDGVVDRFNSNDEYQSQLPVAHVFALAVDSSGDVFVSPEGSGVVQEFDSSGTQVLEIAGTSKGAFGSRTSLAVDAAGNVYVADQTKQIMDEFDSAGTFVGKISEAAGGAFSKPEGVAVNAAGDVYVADASESVPGVVDEFGAPVVVPEPVTGAASNRANTTATVAGTVNPDGTPTTYQFEYGTSTSYGSVSPAAPGVVGSDSTVHPESANLTGLKPGTLYHYRLVASNGTGANEGTEYGEDYTFSTTGPPRVDAQSVTSIVQSGATVDGEVNPGGYETQVFVEYGATSSYGSSTTPIVIGQSKQTVDLPVVLALSGLKASTTYHYQIVAVNECEPHVECRAEGLDETFTIEPPATIEDESFAAASSGSVRLNAEIDGFGTATDYFYEYGTSTAYGSKTPVRSLGAANENVNAPAQLSGLSPDTVYHFRAVASNALGEEGGGDMTFTTLVAPVAGLPDGRGWEMVTPPDNHNAQPYHSEGFYGSPLFEDGSPSQLLARAAADGDAMTYLADPTVGGSGTTSHVAGGGNQYLATRSAAGGWTQTNIQPSGLASQFYEGFSSDLSVGILNSEGETAAEGAQGVPAGYRVNYMRDSDGSYRPFFTETPPYRTAAEFEAAYVADDVSNGGLGYAGASADMSHELFEANDALTENAPGGSGNDPVSKLSYADENNLYDSVDGRLYLVNVLPEGEAQDGATFGAPSEAQGFTSDGPDFSNVISADGSRIFWSSLAPEKVDGEPGNGLLPARPDALYVRENDTRRESPLNEQGECTVPKDACTVLIANGREVRYWAANSEGTKVFFTNGGDLYEYQLPVGQVSGQAVDLTPGSGEAGVLGVLGASENGEYVYFTATTALVPGAAEGAANLYMYHDGETVFVTTLSAGDDDLSSEYTSIGESGVPLVGDWRPSPGTRTAQVAPQGRALVFLSSKSLTGYPNEGVLEVYVYEPGESDPLHCVSCSPSGEPPPFTSRETEEEPGGLLPISHANTFMLRWISEDGSRVFFDSVEPLVPQAANGRMNVYEWERDGSGSCTEASGCIYLLSGGASTAGSWLIDASANGDDVFFTTRGKLVPADQNENVDLYDARVGAAQPLAANACSGTGCQGLPAAPPVFSTPASATFAGVGNFPPPAATVAPKQKPKTAAQLRAAKLAAALKACKAKAGAKRKSCEASARKRYGGKTKAKAKRSQAKAKKSSTSEGI
jgi:hypothetical protein